MADRPRDDTWWLASDDKWYPPTLRPDPEAEARTLDGAGHTARPRSEGDAAVSALLTRALTVVVGTASAGFAVAAVAGFRYGSVLASATATSDEEMAAESLFLGWSSIALLAMAVGGILALMWAFQTSRAFDVRGASGRKWRGGWTIGAWFVPIASLVLPRLVFSELERISQVPFVGDPIGERWKQEQRFTLGDLWWLLWIVGLFIFELTQMIIAEPRLDDHALSIATWLSGGSHAVLAAAGTAFAFVVRRIAASASLEPMGSHER